MGFEIAQARLAAGGVKLATLRRHVERLVDDAADLAAGADVHFRQRHVTITSGAYPDATEAAMSGYLAYCRQNVHDPAVADCWSSPACACWRR